VILTARPLQNGGCNFARQMLLKAGNDEESEVL
jgi:hypothetical protein